MSDGPGRTETCGSVSAIRRAADPRSGTEAPPHDDRPAAPDPATETSAQRPYVSVAAIGSEPPDDPEFSPPRLDRGGGPPARYPGHAQRLRRAARVWRR